MRVKGLVLIILFFAGSLICLPHERYQDDVSTVLNINSMHSAIIGFVFTSHDADSMIA